MRLICAWCQQEGRPAVMREDDASGGAFDSHGICDDHSVRLLDEIRSRLGQVPPLSHRYGPDRVPVGAVAGVELSA
jgi:hypothetical protein